MWTWLLSLEQQRRRLYKRLPDSPLRQFYSVPFAHRRSWASEVSYLSLDLETTGFDPDTDAILSIGHIELKRDQIELCTARHVYVQSHTRISESSAVVHGITDDTAARGLGYRQAIEELLESLAGRVLIAHHSRLETGFLDRACRKLFGGPFISPVVDTLHLALQRLERRQHSFPAGALRLYALREEYGLPRYRAHNALTDAIATAELFLAQMAEKGGSNGPRLNEITLPRRG
ncbi:MAG: 3'-5' exonuclease [Gammaproteobacteria bacterium]|nr:3'-5' exonuclease [Gammaproteobacteria bacterium]